MASIVDTFLENYGADALQLMVEGEAVSTDNGDYTGAFGKCTPEELLGTGVWLSGGNRCYRYMERR